MTDFEDLLKAYHQSLHECWKVPCESSKLPTKNTIPPQMMTCLLNSLGPELAIQLPLPLLFLFLQTGLIIRTTPTFTWDSVCVSVQFHHCQFNSLERRITNFRGSKRGGRTEGVGARKSFLCQRFRHRICILFPIPPSGEGGHNSGEQFLLHLGSCQSPTPSHQPRSENYISLYLRVFCSSGLKHAIICGSMALQSKKVFHEPFPQFTSLSVIFRLVPP